MNSLTDVRLYYPLFDSHVLIHFLEYNDFIDI